MSRLSMLSGNADVNLFSAKAIRIDLVSKMLCPLIVVLGLSKISVSISPISFPAASRKVTE